MKHFQVVLLFILPNLLSAQNLDSMAVVHQLDSLIHLSQAAFAEQKVEKAMLLLEQAKVKADTGLGKMAEAYATRLHAKVDTYVRSGKYTDALPYCIIAKDIRGKVLGKDHPVYALSVSYLATLYKELGQYEKAEPLAMEAKEIRAKNPGKESLQYGITVHLLGTIYYKLGAYDKSESYYLESKNIFVKIPGVKSPQYAIMQTNLAALYFDWGKYEQVEALYLEAKVNQENSKDTASAGYAGTLNNLAWFYFKTGQYIKAKQFFVEANQLFATVYGKDHDQYVASLVNLASLYYETGKYGKAEMLFLKALDILETKKGNKNQYYAATLTNLGDLYTAIDQYDKAEANYLKAKNILEKIFGKNHPDYGTALANLGNLYYKTGKDSIAEQFLLEAKDIRQKVLGIDHPDYATSLNNLAQFYSNNGQYVKAESLFVEAKDIWAKELGMNHPLYSTALQNLGKLFAKKRDFAKAEPLFLEAKSIFTETQGKDHPNYAGVLSDLARLYRSTNRLSESAPLFLELSGIIHHQIENSASFFSEKEMLAYLQTYEGDLAQYQSFAQIKPTREFVCGTFDNALFYNGYLLDNARYLSRSIANADSLTRDTFDRWQGCKRLLATEYTKPITERKQVLELEAQAEAYEKTLTRNLPAFIETRQEPHWQDVRSHLKKGEAAVEFIHYHYYNPNETDSTLYAALVLLPRDTCPHFVLLCEQRQVDSLLRLKYPDKRYERTMSGNSLYSLLWQPIEPLLKGTNTVYYAPSGVLHSVNLDAVALNLGGDSTLIDQYKLVRLGSTRQLGAPVTARIVGNDALLFGGIRYESDSTAIRTENIKKGIAMRGSDEEILPEFADSLQYMKALDPLPSTLEEVGFISQHLTQKKIKPRVFSGLAATEEAFKFYATSGKSSPRIIHLATHGFANNLKTDDSKMPRNLLGVLPFYSNGLHPFLRCGLFLAGADHARLVGKPIPGLEDGILTAYEISAMSLPNTELVVLSACETGLGDMEGNEGVYGLQRAFKISGAQYLIMSLWSVPDDATKDLMSAFYRNWLDKKIDIPSAFREAQLEMKKKDKDPEKWAGFVLVQ